MLSTLEKLVEKHGLQAVLATLALIARDNAEHNRAKWLAAATKIELVSDSIDDL